MNDRMRRLIEDAIKNLDNAIDEIESENLGNDADYKKLSSIINELEYMTE